MTEKFKPWEEDPDQRKAGPVRFVERTIMIDDSDATDRALQETHAHPKTVRILQVYCWSEYSAEYMETEKPKQTGERVWVDVPLEEE